MKIIYEDEADLIRGDSLIKLIINPKIKNFFLYFVKTLLIDNK